MKWDRQELSKLKNSLIFYLGFQRVFFQWDFLTWILHYFLEKVAADLEHRSLNLLPNWQLKNFALGWLRLRLKRKILTVSKFRGKRDWLLCVCVVVGWILMLAYTGVSVCVSVSVSVYNMVLCVQMCWWVGVYVYVFRRLNGHLWGNEWMSEWVEERERERKREGEKGKEREENGGACQEWVF